VREEALSFLATHYAMLNKRAGLAASSTMLYVNTEIKLFIHLSITVIVHSIAALKATSGDQTVRLTAIIWESVVVVIAIFTALQVAASRQASQLSVLSITANITSTTMFRILKELALKIGIILINEAVTVIVLAVADLLFTEAEVHTDAEIW